MIKKIFILTILAAVIFGGCDKKSAVYNGEVILTIDWNTFEEMKAGYLGKILVVNVFASWCPPCADEMPDLVRFAGRTKDMPVVLVGLSIDSNMNDLAKFLQRFNVNFPVYHIGDRVRYRLMAQRVPVTLIFGKDGELHTSIMGAVDERTLMNAVRSLD